MDVTGNYLIKWNKQDLKRQIYFLSYIGLRFSFKQTWNHNPTPHILYKVYVYGILLICKKQWTHEIRKWMELKIIILCGIPDPEDKHHIYSFISRYYE